MNSYLLIISTKSLSSEIEATLRYNHISDGMVREYFEKLNMKPQGNDVNNQNILRKKGRDWIYLII